MEKIIYMLLAVLLWSSCTDDVGSVVETSDNNKVDIQTRLMVTVPASMVYTRTRGVLNQTDHESLITEVQVLVFEEGKFQYRVPGVSVNSNAANTTFTALLKSSGSPLKLLVLANADEAVMACEPSMNDSEETVRKNISQEFDNMTSGFPMYGEYELPAGLASTGATDITGIKMLRAIARIDVKATETTDFILTGVKAYRASSHIQLIPDEAGTARVTIPSVPAGSNANVNSKMFPVAAEDLNEFSAQLYLPEADSPDEGNRIKQATCIVVEGYYRGSNRPSYYRMDFNADDKGDSFGQILRNHKYLFNIRTVSAPGWNTPDDAASNRSANIVAEVQAWDDNTIDMYFDGEHHFGVSAREVVLKHKANSSKTIHVDTDLTDYVLQWADVDGTAEGTGSQSLTNEYFKVEKSQQGEQLTITALKDNKVNNTLHSQNFIITASRWRVLINIRQSYNTAAYKTISLLTFNAGLGYLGTNVIGSTSPEARSNGLRGILDNQHNFGPNGTVECGGYNLVGVNANNNKLTDALFTSFDVVFVHYMSNGTFGNQDAQKVHDWLKAKKNRVLIASYDAADVSQNMLNEVLGENNGIAYFRSNTGAYPLATPTVANSYFTTAGPFTSGEYTPVDPDFSFRNYDAYHGEIMTSTQAATGITPILMGPKGGIVLGVDYSRRIVYIGDTDLNSTAIGSGASGSNRINNTAGNIDSNASKLIANVFAWITETVLYGE